MLAAAFALGHAWAFMCCARVEYRVVEEIGPSGTVTKEVEEV